MQTIQTNLADQPFTAVEVIPPLVSGEIHLWLWRLTDSVPPRLLTGFARRELVRLLQIYANSHLAPQFKQGKHGKPYVESAEFPHFNVSHADDCVALAFCRDQELGVDVERGSMRRSRSATELASRFFASEEAMALAKLPDGQRERAFLHLWTCKEAVLKALGHGLSFGLDRLRFVLGSDGEPQAMASIADEAGDPAEWQIHRFVPGNNHVGSLAWRGTPHTIRTFLLQPTATAD